MNKRKIQFVIRKIKGIDILDGRTRFERVSRRLLILLMGIAILVLSLNVFCDSKEQEINIQEDIKINEEEEIETQSITEIVEVEKPDTIKEYIKRYNGRINDEYLTILRNYCDEDTLKLVVAISVAETSMGKNTNNHSNFYGYFYGGDRSYDPNYDEMSMVICRGISKYYSDVATNKTRAIKYVGSDNVDMWMKNVNKVLSAI